MANGLRREAFNQSSYDYWTGRYGVVNVKDFGASGGGVLDDTASILSAIKAVPVGGMLVFPPGTYIFNPLNQAISNMQIVGLGIAEEVVIVIPGPSTYTGASAFSGITNVTFKNLKFRAPSANLFSIFATTNNVSWSDCIVEDCSPQFQEGGTDVYYSNVHFVQSSIPPTTMQMTIGGVTGNLYVNKCNFNFAFNGGSGILINVANNSSAPQNVWIKDNHIMDDNLPGYTVDAAIDIEPTGSTPIEHCEIEGNVIFNSKIYASGMAHGIIKNNTLRTTSNGLQNGVSPISGYNNYTPIPSSGDIEISGNRIIQDNVATSSYSATPISWSVAGDINRLSIHDNDIQMNSSATATPGNYGNTLSSVIQIAGTYPIGEVEIRDNRFTLTNTISGAIVNLLALGTANNLTMVRVDRNRVFGGFSAAKFVEAMCNTAGGLVGKIYIDGNDISNLGISASFFGSYQTTYSQLITERNVGYNPVGSQTPPANPLVSGTVYQNLYGMPITVYQPAYASVAGTAGTVAAALGSTNTPATLFTQIVSGATTSTIPEVVILRVPVGWYYSFTVSGSVLQNASIQGE